LCKEHDDDVDNDEKIILFQIEEKERYNVDFSDLHIINICNEEKKKERARVLRRTTID
jgi:uncharacterized protein YwgA